jgi:hypothetical protein
LVQSGDCGVAGNANAVSGGQATMKIAEAQNLLQNWTPK